jgi:hypothetical protein
MCVENERLIHLIDKIRELPQISEVSGSFIQIWFLEPINILFGFEAETTSQRIEANESTSSDWEVEKKRRLHYVTFNATTEHKYREEKLT